MTVTNTKNYEISVNGITYEFRGQWIPYHAKRVTIDPLNSYPAEGGYFDEYEIFHAGDDMTEVLSDTVINQIVGEAERKMGR